MIRLFLLPVLLILGCSKGERGRDESLKAGADSVKVVSTSDGRKLWVMKAVRVEERGDTLVGFGIRIRFYSSGEISSVLTADSGKYDRVSGDMVAYGRVHLVSSDSTEVWTSSLNWDEKRRIIWTEDSVRIFEKKRNRTLFAKGMETDAEISYIKFKSPVRGEGEMEE